MLSKILLNVSYLCSAPKDRFPLLFWYLWFTWKYIFINRVFKLRWNSARFLGFKVIFPSYWRFYYLFESLFVQCEYLFPSSASVREGKLKGNPQPRIIDGGSNIGLSVLYLKYLYPQARILAFEPEPETFEVLKQNVERNGLKGVSLYNVALERARGEIPFYASECGSLCMSTIKERGRGKKIMVPSVLLSDFLDEPVDLLKLDLEGSEGRVLEEVVEKGKLNQVKHLILEYHNLPGNLPLPKVLELLERNGFQYQFRSTSGFSQEKEGYEDLLIYAYQKGSET